MDEKDSNQGMVASLLLEDSGISLLDAARLALELKEMLPPGPLSQPSSMAYCRHLIRLGAEACAMEADTVCFREAVEKSLLSRAARRARTLAEIRQCCRRILRCYPELAEMPIRRIQADFCRKIITDAFHTPTTRRKARCLLHGIFEFCVRHGWCAANPIVAIDVPVVREKPIEVLSVQQLRRLLATALRPEHIACAPALGFLLWTGIRPTELTRVRWKDVNLADKTLTIDACHSKTGGARQVPIRSSLVQWLSMTAPYRLPQSFLVPCSWIRRWRNLRMAAGFQTWHPDVLRHTFASYHLKYFNDFRMLQVEMGHADLQLLRTRYLGMRGITSKSAHEFWGCRSATPLFEYRRRKK